MIVSSGAIAVGDETSFTKEVLHGAGGEAGFRGRGVVHLAHS